MNNWWMIDQWWNSHNDIEEILVGKLILKEKSERLVNARQQSSVRTAQVQEKNDTSTMK